MPYFIIKIPSSEDIAYCVESPHPDNDEFRPGDFRMGKEITYSVSALSVKTDKKHGSTFLDVIPAQGLELIISAKLFNVFNALHIHNLQYFPVSVIDCFSKKNIHSYFVCNIIGLIPCLDINRAEIVWSKTKDEIFIINKIALDETVINKYNSAIDLPLKIFRLQERPQFIIVHSDIREAVLKLGIKGIEFRKPEEAGDFL